MMKHFPILAVALTLALSGCGKDIVLPPYDALVADEESQAGLYKLTPGPFKVVDVDGIELAHQEGRTFEMRALYPEAEGPFPVLMFSHGNWSDTQSYDNLVRHWVSHGYVVLMPLHLDGKGAVRGIFNSLRYGQMGLIRERIEDVELVFDSVEAWATPALQARMDLSRIAATGHSFGAFTAQQLGGARALNDDTGEWYRPLNTAFKAVVAVSPPGPMFDVITADSWDELESPTLVTTGTWDMNKSFWPEWELHRMSFDRAPAGDKYALVVQGMDHYLGNLICQLDREQPPQHDQLKVLRSVTTAFLDAYVKDDAAARGYIAGSALTQAVGNFASLSHK